MRQPDPRFFRDAVLTVEQCANFGIHPDNAGTLYKERFCKKCETWKPCRAHEDNPAYIPDKFWDFIQYKSKDVTGKVRHRQQSICNACLRKDTNDRYHQRKLAGEAAIRPSAASAVSQLVQLWREHGALPFGDRHEAVALLEATGMANLQCAVLGVRLDPKGKTPKPYQFTPFFPWPLKRADGSLAIVAKAVADLHFIEPRLIPVLKHGAGHIQRMPQPASEGLS